MDYVNLQRFKEEGHVGSRSKGNRLPLFGYEPWFFEDLESSDYDSKQYLHFNHCKAVADALSVACQEWSILVWANL